MSELACFNCFDKHLIVYINTFFTHTVLQSSCYASAIYAIVLNSSYKLNGSLKYRILGT